MTPEFGASWGALKIEKSAQVAGTAIKTTDAYKESVQANVGYHVVEVINNEVISAALDLSNN